MTNPIKNLVVSSAALAAGLLPSKAIAQQTPTTIDPSIQPREVSDTTTTKKVEVPTIAWADAAKMQRDPLALAAIGGQPLVTIQDTVPAARRLSMLDVRAGQTDPQKTSGRDGDWSFLKTKKDRDYSVQMTFGPHIKENISPTTMRFKTSEMDLTINHVKWEQRESLKYYNIPGNIKEQAAKGGDHPLLRGLFQWADEPVNELGIKFQKYFANGNPDFALGISMYHPKMVMSVGWEKTNDQNKDIHVIGTLDGQPVDKNMDLDQLFNSFRLSHQFVNFSVSADKNYTILDGKAGALVANIGGRLGVYAGKVEYMMDNRQGDGGVLQHYDHPENKMAPIGYNATLQAGLTYMLPGGRFGLGVKGEASVGRLSYDFMDGNVTQKHQAQSMQVFLLVDVFGHSPKN